MLFLKVEVLELDEAAERDRINGAFKNKTRDGLLAILDCVLKKDLEGATAALATAAGEYDGEDTFAEFLHPVVYEVLARYAKRHKWLADFEKLSEADRQAAQAKPVNMVARLAGAPADLTLRMTYPRIVPFTEQLDLETLGK